MKTCLAYAKDYQSTFCTLTDIPEKFLDYHTSLFANRPLALRGHVTNTSLKQLVGILLMPKIDRAHKNYLTP